MNVVDSPFYPPRATWWSRRITQLGWFGRTAVWQGITRPEGTNSWGQFALWIIAPGLCAYSRRRRALGSLIFGAWVAMLAVHWIWVGATISGWAYVGMTCIHSFSVTMAISACLAHRTPRARTRIAALWTFAFVIAFYVIFPLPKCPALPVTAGGKVILVHSGGVSTSLRRGEWVAYRFGYGQLAFEQVAGLPGETVNYRPDGFEVDGRVYQRTSAAMPESGSVTVPEDTYLIWPTLKLGGYTPEYYTNYLARLTKVRADQIIGRPYRQWLWRKQHLPDLVELNTPKLQQAVQASP